MAIKTSAMSVSTLRSSAPCSKLPSPQLTTRLLTLVAIVVVLIFQSVIVPTAEARYLPTRSNVDQLKRQEIKEILRLVSQGGTRTNTALTALLWTHPPNSLSLSFPPLLPFPTAFGFAWGAARTSCLERSSHGTEPDDGHVWAELHSSHGPTPDKWRPRWRGDKGQTRHLSRKILPQKQLNRHLYACPSPKSAPLSLLTAWPLVPKQWDITLRWAQLTVSIPKAGQSISRSTPQLSQCCVSSFQAPFSFGLCPCLTLWNKIYV